MSHTIKKKSIRGRTLEGAPNPIDCHVGNRVRLRRSTLGFSQEKLASLLGLTFQQIQKYERGVNRIGASRMWDIGHVLGVDINFFIKMSQQKLHNKVPKLFSHFSSSSK